MAGVDARAEGQGNRRFQHPAVGAALAARNAVAAEMAMAARSGAEPSDPCWEEASRHAACADGAAHALALPIHQRDHGHSLLGNDHRSARRSPRGRLPARATARRRRELLEMALWFAVGGLGGLGVLALVRLIESFFMSR